MVWLEPAELEADAAALEERWQKIVAELIDPGDLLRPPRPPFEAWASEDYPDRTIKAHLTAFPSLLFTAEVRENEKTSDAVSPATYTLAAHRVEAFLIDVRRF